MIYVFKRALNKGSYFVANGTTYIVKINKGGD